MFFFQTALGTFEQKHHHHITCFDQGAQDAGKFCATTACHARLSRAFLHAAMKSYVVTCKVVTNCILFLSLRHCAISTGCSQTFLYIIQRLEKNSTKGTNMQCGPMYRYQNRKNRGRNQRIYRVFKQVRCRCHSWHEYSIVIVAQCHCSKPLFAFINSSLSNGAGSPPFASQLSLFGSQFSCSQIVFARTVCSLEPNVNTVPTSAGGCCKFLCSWVNLQFLKTHFGIQPLTFPRAGSNDSTAMQCILTYCHPCHTATLGFYRFLCLGMPGCCVGAKKTGIGK